MKGENIGEDVDFDELAEITEVGSNNNMNNMTMMMMVQGYSGSDLNAVCKDARQILIQRQTGLEKDCPITEELIAKMNERIRMIKPTPITRVGANYLISFFKKSEKECNMQDDLLKAIRQNKPSVTEETIQKFKEWDKQK